MLALSALTKRVQTCSIRRLGYSTVYSKNPVKTKDWESYFPHRNKKTKLFDPFEETQIGGGRNVDDIRMRVDREDFISVSAQSAKPPLRVDTDKVYERAPDPGKIDLVEKVYRDLSTSLFDTSDEVDHGKEVRDAKKRFCEHKESEAGSVQYKRGAKPSPPSDRKSTALRPATSRDTGSRTDIYTQQDGTRKPGRDGNVDTFLAHSTPTDLTKYSSSSTTQLDESLLRPKTDKDVELQIDPVKYDLVAQVKSSVHNEQLSHIERKARLNEAWIMVRKFKKLKTEYFASRQAESSSLPSR